MKNSIQSFKTHINTITDAGIFKQAAECFKKELNEYLRKLYVSNITWKINKFYAIVTFGYKGRQHEISIGDYLIYEEESPFIIYTALRYNDKHRYSVRIPFQDVEQFDMDMKAALLRGTE